MRLTLILLAHMAVPAFALTTAYVSFDHPDGWRCELSQGVWICQSAVDPDRKESVILSIATMATEWDSIENYEDYLKQPRTIQDEEGKTITSKVTYVRKRNINGVWWIDSLQQNSELPGFWARYLATVHTTNNSRLAILITYIVSEERYQSLAPQFERMVASLKPNSEFDLNIASKQGIGALPGAEKLGPLEKNILKDRLALPSKKKDEPKAATQDAGDQSGDESSNALTTLAPVGGVAAIAYILLRRRRKAKEKAKKAKSMAPERRAG